MKNLVKPLLLLAILASSCTPKFNYLGNSYAPTHNVEIYFDEKDIPHEYTVMGFMKNEAREFANDLDDIQLALIEAAKEQGADAILITNTYKDQINSVDGLGDKNFDWLSVNHAKVLEAKLLKFKR